MGPALGGIVGEGIAAGEGYGYSSALAGLSVQKWYRANLHKWLLSPSAFAPGNNMAFVGLVDEQDRADVIEFLS